MEKQSTAGRQPPLEGLIRQTRLVAFDFDGVFTDNSVFVFEDGSEAVRCCRSDGIGLQRLASLGIKTVIISTEINPVVGARSRKLKIDWVQGCEDKRAVLERITLDLGVPLTQTAYVGNDVNDLDCLACVGLPIVVQDAHPDVIPLARYQTRALGGHGAVREICDLFARVIGLEGNNK